MDVNVIILGIIVSGIGSGMVIYGKVKTQLWPLIFGLALIIAPFIFSSILGLLLITALLLIGAYLLREQ